MKLRFLWSCSSHVKQDDIVESSSVQMSHSISKVLKQRSENDNSSNTSWPAQWPYGRVYTLTLEGCESSNPLLIRTLKMGPIASLLDTQH